MPGFALSPTQADVCCRDRDGGAECYVWMPVDPNVMSCGSAGASCGCHESQGGHDYQLDCDDATKRCSCKVDGAERAAFGPDAGVCEAGTAAIWTQCGFP
jgi:hypothetical protein